MCVARLVHGADGEEHRARTAAHMDGSSHRSAATSRVAIADADAAKSEVVRLASSV